MTNLPFSIDRRPFALEHSTGLMLPDGIFDLGLTRINIGFIVRNNLEIPLNFFGLDQITGPKVSLSGDTLALSSFDSRISRLVLVRLPFGRLIFPSALLEESLTH